MTILASAPAPALTTNLSVLLGIGFGSVALPTPYFRQHPHSNSCEYLCGCKWLIHATPSCFRLSSCCVQLSHQLGFTWTIWPLPCGGIVALPLPEHGPPACEGSSMTPPADTWSVPPVQSSPGPRESLSSPLANVYFICQLVRTFLSICFVKLQQPLNLCRQIPLCCLLQVSISQPPALSFQSEDLHVCIFQQQVKGLHRRHDSDRSSD